MQKNFRAIMSMAVVGSSLGLMAFDWPTQLSWLKPRTEKPSAAAVQKAADKVDSKTYQLKGWLMTIQTDHFTGRVRCRLFSMRTLSQGRITFAQNTLGFELGKDVSTLKAWYRIDSQPVQRVSDLYPILVENRIDSHGGSLENPTGGVVFIPVDQLIDARVVTIRTYEKSEPERFVLKNFEAALAAARFNGCATDDAFERYAW